MGIKGVWVQEWWAQEGGWVMIKGCGGSRGRVGGIGSRGRRSNVVEI